MKPLSDSAPRLVLLMGPPAVGKTSVARSATVQLQKRYGRPVVHVEVDDLRHMIVDDGDPFRERAADLLEAVVERSLGFAAVVLVEGLFWDDRSVARARALHPGNACIVLHAPLETRMRRNRERPAGEERLADESIAELSATAAWNGFHVLDASRPVDDVARELVRYLGFSQ